MLAASVAVVGTLAAAIFTQVWTARREDQRRAEERVEKDLANKREDRLRLNQDRRVAYVNYLRALHDASEAIRDLAVKGLPLGDAETQDAANVLRDSRLLAAREEVYLVRLRNLPLLHGWRSTASSLSEILLCAAAT